MAGVVIPDLEIPSGTPLVYEVDADLRPIPKKFFAAAHGNSDRAIMTYREDMAEEIIPGLAAAHGDSIRAIMTYREDMADEIIPGLDNMRGTPLVREFDADLELFPDYLLVAAEGKSIRAIGRAWRIWPSCHP